MRSGSMYFPIFMDLKGRRVLVIGGGKIAVEKLRKIVFCDADTVVITKEVKDEYIEELAERGKIKLEIREFEESDLEGVFIVVSATDNKELNQRVYNLCNSRNIPVNSVDQKDKCSFIFSAEIRRGDLTVAVSTGGASPGLAARIRNQIEDLISDDAEIYIEEAKNAREEIKSKEWESRKKSKILKEIAREIDIFVNGKEEELKAKIRDILDRA
jgi:precorrin-2 dehydrogenase / sirohydrochlorin ferrochelatase